MPPIPLPLPIPRPADPMDPREAAGCVMPDSPDDFNDGEAMVEAGNVAILEVDRGVVLVLLAI